MPITARFAAAAARAYGLFSKLVQAVDPYFNYTTLLLPGNGTNGAQNNTFLDSSSNAFTITRNGNTTQGNFSPFSQTGWGNYFDGATATRLTLPSNAAFAFGTGAYTVEAWVYLTAYGTQTTIFDAGSASGAFDFAVTSSGALSVGAYGVGAVLSSSASAVPLNQWVYVAAVRTSTSANGTALFVNGTSVTTGTDASNWTVTTTPNIAGYNLAGYTLTGYISNLRVTKGGALYSANFTPSTTPLTTTVSAGTVSLLTCQSNRFVDNSSNAFAITANGSPSVQAFSPFAPTAAWSASTNGGSGYFDGSGDNLTAPANTAFAFAKGDFTVEMWIFPVSNITSTANIGLFYIEQTNGLVVGLSNGYLAMGSRGSSYAITSSYIPPLNTWTHVAVTRSGATAYIFANGTQVGTATASGGNPANNSDYVCTTGLPTVAGNYAGGAGFGYFPGYISDLRVLKGTAVYTAAFTPPTAPLTNITNTSLLLSATNGGIVDATAKNDLETVGNAQISTTQSKFGGSSIKCTAAGDYLTPPYSQNINFGTGNFTIECWFYLNALSSSYYVVGGTWSSATSDEWLIQIQNNGTIRFLTTADTAFYGSGITSGTWYHFAASRASGSLKVFLNGTSIATITNSNSIGSVSKVLQLGQQVGGVWPLNGYIDDFRITKGVARYTANFTPPTSAFLLQ